MLATRGSGKVTTMEALSNTKAKSIRNPSTANNQKTLTCFKCGKQGYYKSDFPELKNRNHRNQAGGTKTRGMV
ncbi:reverse transcriptase domain-containing protein [Tanacetum coccineum]